MNIKTENIISTSQKRVFYIVLVMLLLASLASVLYLFFVLVNIGKPMFILNDRQEELIGSIMFMLGAMLGIPVGKKWWRIVYEERGRGAFLKVRR
jgi:hypothetical protein